MRAEPLRPFVVPDLPEQMPDAPMQEDDHLRAQLLTFARDLNEVYRRERTRARQLEVALDELHESYLATIRTLATVVEAKDAQTRSHLDRTQLYAIALAERVAPELAHDTSIRFGSLLHDIGKIGVPESVLGKDGPLSREEWEIIKTHPLIGGQICRPVKFLQGAIPLIEAHHERWDGTGYPRGLRGEEIPLPARIFSIVDAYDAMTSDRPYRTPLTTQQALEEITRSSGTQFDPEIVSVFVGMCTEGSPFAHDHAHGHA